MSTQPRRGPTLSPLSSRVGTPHPQQEEGSATGGRDNPVPQIVNRRIQVAETNHPATDRWVTLSTTLWDGTYRYVVGVVDGFTRPVLPRREFPALGEARTYANRLLDRMAEED